VRHYPVGSAECAQQARGPWHGYSFSGEIISGNLKFWILNSIPSRKI
jgi:hypothetical protein